MAEIFLLEDSRPLRRILTYQLRDAGHNVTGFENGVVSADHELVSNADVMVTDIAMPTVDGEQAISNVKKHFPEMPIIVITADRQKNFDELGVFGGLHKPFSEHELCDLVQRALQGREHPKPTGRVPRREAS